MFEHAVPTAPLDELLRSNRTLRSRVAELEALNVDLRRELAQAGAAPSPLQPPSPLAARLSAREREVLRLLTEGCRSPCIAERLGIAVATVEVHRRNIMRKLELHTVAALTKYAVRTGLTSL